MITNVGTTFQYNQISSVRLPANRIREVTLPSSLLSINPDAFFEQNKYGGNLEFDMNAPYFMWSTNPAIVQAAYNEIWYVKGYTQDPSNPQGLTDTIMSEAWWAGWDGNANGTQRDSLGGVIINPASATLRYVNAHGIELKPSEQVVGLRTSDNTPLRDYLVTSSDILAPVDPTAPTPQEETDLQAGFAQYYRIGQNKTFSAPVIPGYTTPPSRTVTLAKDNTVTFVYQTLQAPTFTAPSPTSGVALATFTVGGVCAESARNQTIAATPEVLRQATVLTGAAFTVTCATPQTEATVAIDLDRNFQSSQLKVFKQARAVVNDITDHVTFGNDVVDGKTVTTIHYTIKDGGFGDEDNTIDGKIVDPIFVTFVGKIAELPNAPNTGLAGFSQNALQLIIGAVVLSLAAVIVLILYTRLTRRGNG